MGLASFTLGDHAQRRYKSKLESLLSGLHFHLLEFVHGGGRASYWNSIREHFGDILLLQAGLLV